MVKNTQGGSKHKGLARKSVNAAPSAHVRVPEEEGECFAHVTAMSGNGMCKVDVSYNDAIITDVTCFIRGKFKSKSKRQNIVSKGSFIIIGLRLWSSDLTKCDLLEVLQLNASKDLQSNTQFKVLHAHILHETPSNLYDVEFSQNLSNSITHTHDILDHTHDSINATHLDIALI
jgi:hypothetical protein